MISIIATLTVACGDNNADSGAGLTREEVREIVRAEMVALTPVPGLTRPEVEEAIRTALAGMPAPEPGLTQADAAAAIQAALARVPEPGITRTEAEDLIRTAMAALPPPESGLTAAEAELIARGVVFTAPAKSAPAEYTRFFVRNAIGRYETQGLDATLAHYNRPESVDGQWYVFIVDEDDQVIAHPDGSLLGLDLKGPVGTDANGYNFGQEMVSADEDGRWVSYVYGNPANRNIGSDFGELQLKNAWVVRHGGLLFGSGWYVDADEFTKAFVAAAVRKYHAVGLEGTVEYFTGSESDFAGLAAAIDYYNSVETLEGEWSAFIVDGTGKIVDHYDKELVGRSLRDLFGVAMFEASEEGNWVATESLRLWVVSHDGLVFGSGWHRGEGG